MKTHYYRRRFFEIIPGLAVWSALALPIILSGFFPVAVAIFILLFDLYWLYKALIMIFHLIQGFQQLEHDIAYDWLKKAGDHVKQIRQAVILTTYLEPLEVIEQSIQSLLHAEYPVKNIVVVLAVEEREGDQGVQKANTLQRRYRRRFGDFLVTVHPDNIAGERKAKGANATWAAKKLTKWARSHRIDPTHILVTAADADTRFHKSYFAALTYHYISTDNPSKRSFQPIPVYANNIWQAPPMSRVLAFGSSFWQLIESTRPWRLINFSTHSMSLKTLQDINYWDVTVINEDSRQFWRAYFALHGEHQVIPIFIPVYMDAVLTDSYLGTLSNQYKQRLRWAYGIEHFPYVIEESLKHTEINFWDRFIKIYRLFEANFSWATASFFLAFVAWIPIFLNQDFSQTVLGHNVPIFASRILSLTWIGLVVSAFLSFRLLPPKPRGYRHTKTVTMILQWVLAPISAVVFGSIPAIDAQTRLMLGLPFGFWTTQKKAVRETN